MQSATLQQNCSESKMDTIPKTLNNCLFIVFVVNTVFLPADNFNLKIISLLLLLLFNAPSFFNCKSGDEKVVLIFGFALTTINILWSIVLTGNLQNIRLGYPGYILLLYIIVKKQKINFQKIFIETLKYLAYFIVLMALLDLTHIVDMFSNPILLWFSSGSNAMVGKGSHLPIYYMLFFKTTPLLFIALLHYFKRNEYLNGLVVLCAIILSGTRANIIMLLFLIILFFCFLHSNKQVRYISFGIILIVGLFIVLDGRVIEFFIDMFVRKASSDSTRTGHIEGILEGWKNDSLSFFIGSGFSSEFYSYGTNEFTANIELSYWNLLRQVGLFLFIPTMVMFFYPFIKLYKRKEMWVMLIAYGAYLIIAYTNPFLYSSTGMVLLVYMYCLIFHKGVSKNERNYFSGRKRNKTLSIDKSHE